MAETNTIQEILLRLGDQPINLNVAIPGVQGKDGENGRNGADGLSAYDIAQLEGFTGTRQEWIESLKAGAVATDARSLLLQGNVWCKSPAIADVLSAIITNLGKAFPRTEFKPLTVGTVLKGQRVIAVEGEPHYFVKVSGVETQFEIGDDGTSSITIEPFGVDDVRLTYHNFTGEKVGETVITGIYENTRTPDDTYTDATGAKFEKYGRKLVLRLAIYNENSFNWLGKWNKSDIETLEIISDTKKKIVDDSTKGYKYDGITFIIKKPNNVAFGTKYGQGTVTVNTMERTISVTLDSSNIEYADGVYNKSGAAASEDL
ncbi:hypothetical protein QP561_06860 [Veillonella nakazawae]|nr:hypothetical protein [Veillonella nakazawae]MDK7739966.1 hypothetical protein [Veillonella nakazawae]